MCAEKCVLPLPPPPLPLRRNPTAAAAETFIRVQKSYRVLTDKTAAANFRKYGTPDGYQGHQFGLGVPAAMLSEGALVPALVLVFLAPLLAWYLGRDPTAAARRRLVTRAQDLYLKAALDMVDESDEKVRQVVSLAVALVPSTVLAPPVRTWLIVGQETPVTATPLTVRHLPSTLPPSATSAQ